MRIKNFDKFQHFKDRCPPWVKLYRDLLNDIEWFELDPKAAKALVSLWLMASEDETKQGILPSVKQIAFRLRQSETDIKNIISKLSHWLEQDDIDVISDCNQTDAPEKRREETETDISAAEQRECSMARFEIFYSAYPKKRNRGEAEKAWKSIRPDDELTARIVEAVEVASHSDDWRKDQGKFIPYPASWLRAKGWEDEIQKPESKDAEVYQLPDFMRGAL